jgi:two-component system response regulator YesN
MNARVINKASDYIVKNCHKNLSLEEVAHTVHLSPFYFSRLFKAEKGMNFVEFLTKARIERAKRMLKYPDQTIARIALECGYQDASYFCRVFRQEVNVTPNQYRAASRKSKVE